MKRMWIASLWFLITLFLTSNMFLYATEILSKGEGFGFTIGGKGFSLEMIIGSLEKNPGTGLLYSNAGLGTDIRFTNEVNFDVTEFTDEPYEWWIYKGRYKYKNEVGVYFSMDIATSSTMKETFAWGMRLMVGLSMQEYGDLYRSTATGWYWIKSYPVFFLTYGIGVTFINFSHNGSLGLTFFYHNRRGICAGITFAAVPNIRYWLKNTEQGAKG